MFPIPIEFSKRLTRFLKDESGPTTVEYALMVALILLGVIVSVGALSNSIKDTYGNIVDHMQTALAE